MPREFVKASALKVPCYVLIADRKVRVVSAYTFANKTQLVLEETNGSGQDRRTVRADRLFELAPR